MLYFRVVSDGDMILELILVIYIVVNKGMRRSLRIELYTLFGLKVGDKIRESEEFRKVVRVRVREVGKGECFE